MKAMLVIILHVHFAAAGAGDPCVAPPAAGDGATDASPRDVAAAAAYRGVADDARRAGDLEPARVAYRAALRHDPADAESRAALEALCRANAPVAPAEPAVAPPEAGRFDEGARLMERGDRAGAIAAFEAARASGPDGATALLEGICELELGHDRRARELLEQALAEPRVSSAASFYLGLIALEHGEPATASALFLTASASGGSIAESAADLLHAGRGDGRVVVTGLAEIGVDSNVQLLPDGTATGGGSADGYTAGLAGLVGRPLGPSGPYARLTAQYRKQLQISAYDLGDVSGALGVRSGHLGRSLAAEYEYDFVSLGGASYLSAHRLLGTGRWTSGRLSLSAAYAARVESFLTPATTGYSGLRQDAEAEAGWRFWPRVNVALGYHGGIDLAQQSTFRYVEHGPLAVARLGASGSARIVGEAGLTWRTYDGVDPDLGVERADRYLDGGLTAELDVGAHWTVRASGTARRALSNVADFQYTKLTAGLGLVYALRAL